jgi:hypothetical protein
MLTGVFDMDEVNALIHILHSQGICHLMQANLPQAKSKKLSIQFTSFSALPGVIILLWKMRRVHFSSCTQSWPFQSK